MKTMDKIVEKTLNMKITEEKRIRELIRIVPHSSMGVVKSCDVEGEPISRYSIFFKNLSETNGLQEAIDNDKKVLVTLKMIGGRPSVIKSEIRTPNVKIPESSLEEQQKESEAFGDY